MLTLPVPLVASLILIYLVLRAALRRTAPAPLLWLIAAEALQGAVISGRLHYGITWLGLVQPVLAMTIPPLAFLAFELVARRGRLVPGDLWHLVGPAFGAFCVGMAPAMLDHAVLASFFGYGAALWIALRAGRDTLERTRLDSGEAPLRVWRWIALALVLSGFSDVIILAMDWAGLGAWRGLTVSLMWGATLLAIGGLALSEVLAPGEDAPEAAPPPVATADDAALVRQMEALLADRQLFLDPGLTLAQIARRQRVPAKTLSAAINRVKGENVSRVVNGLRIAHACALLQAGSPVTQAMLESGFNTKSNFNREFLRVTGRSPSGWLRGQGA
ncbi:MAG: helix-turn-helix transcriptional regulator [Gemmobacter sp.]|uniref:helix-turn-helix domain-containing protein n=1 Tax=Gemmobacter sp. TaxID=1898957 RepID=UPI001A45A1A6|nr:AraC family transcriptional regulator [Gemmobacter sp.]MBL8563056.1 helix-turn-helix transcriptional regulator [Gemmobacter sp.]